VANVLAAASSRLFVAVPLLDAFDGFHALNVLLGALLLVVLYRFVERHTSTAAAVLTVLLLFLLPRLVGDFFANIKDYPEMVFFSLTLVAFFAAYERGSARGIGASGALWGLAIGTKANAAFILPIVVLYIAARGLGEHWRDRRRTLLLALVGAGIIAGAIVFASWPYLWEAPVARILENYRYVSGRAFDQATTDAPWWQMLLYTTPPIVLLLFAASLPLFVGRARRREPLAILLLVWIAVVATRLSLPGALNFDGVRHFLELFPPLVMIAAIGSVELARRFISSSAVRAAVLAVPIVLTANATVQVHPFELVYWNALIGGYSGARAAGIPQASDYWATSYRQGMRWINTNAPPNTLLVVTVSPHTVAMAAPLRLRPDIGVATLSAERAYRMAATRPVFVMFVPREEWRTPLDRTLERTQTPTASWERDGAPVLLIYQLSAPR
ncbi:MAG: hypothetical protein QOH21_88, partial [Acidobacteriota bacterium]|jgi:hypothetical protein|nr:hypothetical protein [Acidobacteriota bacterium]